MRRTPSFADFPALPPFEEQLSRLGDAILDRAGERAAALPGDVFSIFVDLLAVFFVSLLLLTNRLRIRDFVLSLTYPDHRRRIGLVLDRTRLRIGGYLRAKVIVMAIVGALTYVSLIVIGVPFAIPPRDRGLRRVDPARRRLARAHPTPRDRGARQSANLRADLPGVDLDPESAGGTWIPWSSRGDQLDIHPLLVFVVARVGSSSAAPSERSSPSLPRPIVDLVVREVVVPVAPCAAQGLRRRRAAPPYGIRTAR